MWSNFQHHAAADLVQSYESDVNSKAKVADNVTASFDPIETAHADSGTARAAQTHALQLVANITVTELELYNKCRTLLMHDPYAVLTVTPDEVQTLHSEAKKKSIEIESYFGKEYVPAVQSKAEQSNTEAISSDPAIASASISPENSDEALDYSANLMP